MNESSSNPLVVIVDDQPDVVHELSVLLQANGLETVGYNSGEALLGHGVPPGTSCILLDLNFRGGMNGLRVLELLRERGLAVPVLIVSGTGRIGDAVRAMRAGAADFIEKPYRAEELLAALRSCIANENPAAATAALRIRFASLSQREREVMHAVTSGLSSKEIAFQLDLSPRTVEVHRLNLMTKIQARNVADLIRLAFHAGEYRPG